VAARIAVVLLGCLLAGGCDVVFRVDHVDVGDDGVDGSGGREIVYVQSGSLALAAVPQASVTFENAPQAGDLVVVAIGTYQGNLVSVSDSAGNAYVEPRPGLDSDGNTVLHLLFAPNVKTAIPFTVTATVAANALSEVTMAIHDYRGASADPLDKHVLASGHVDVPVSSGPVMTTTEGELYFAAVSHDNTTKTNPTGSFVVRQRPTENSAGAVPLVTADMVGPAGDAISADFTFDVNASWVCGLVTFK
jgi:hypothetical protein